MNRNYHQEHVSELNNLPKIYTIKMAIQNNDVVVSSVMPRNPERFFQFLLNVENGIPDKIRIAAYGIDEPQLASKSILEYNGSIFIYTVINGSTAPITYVGNEIVARYAFPYKAWQYFLVTFDGREIWIFSLYNQTLYEFGFL